MQRTLIAIGIIIILIGLAWPWVSKIPFGKLPGDIVVSGEKYKAYFPIVTSLVLSAVLTLLFWLFRK